MANIFESHIKKDKLHHAYLIEGDNKILDELKSFLSTCEIVFDENPDITCEEFGTFKISDSRILGERQNETSISGKRIFIISIFSITIEAQQSLLKMFEEPSENTHFFVIVPSTEIFIPTLRSRMQIISTNRREDLTEIKNGKKFVGMTKKERLQMIAGMIKSHDKDESSVELKKEANSLLNEIEVYLSEKSPKVQLSMMKEIIRAREYINLRGSSIKMILENIALQIPNF